MSMTIPASELGFEEASCLSHHLVDVSDQHAGGKHNPYAETFQFQADRSSASIVAKGGAHSPRILEPLYPVAPRVARFPS